MKKKLFGTDGVRGKANQFPMIPEILMKLATATGQLFMTGSHRHTVIIGKDTRLSGYMIEPALVAGFISAGMDVIMVGPLPTPAVAMLTRTMRADLGVMISASHNPFEDNGIKFFSPEGSKLSDAMEIDIENIVLGGSLTNLAHSATLGRAERLDDARGRYIEYVKHSLPKSTRLEGLKVVVDCANGASYKVAPKVLWELGAEVIALGVTPDGKNINELCGATDTTALKAAVLEHKADIGIALDGDADRVALVDEKGQDIDGDQILGLLALNWKKLNKLHGDGVVGTVMSNLGLELFLQQQDMKLYRSAVGDRYVSEEMMRHGCNLGGEQSGHIILKDVCTTGDGLIAALQVLRIIVEEKAVTSKVCRPFQAIPQVLTNVKIGTNDPLKEPTVQHLIEWAEKELSGNGRLLIRRSGTESILRVMAEGYDALKIQNIVDQIAQEVTKCSHH